jgi:hypothetical protein
MKDHTTATPEVLDEAYRSMREDTVLTDHLDWTLQYAGLTGDSTTGDSKKTKTRPLATAIRIPPGALPSSARALFLEWYPKYREVRFFTQLNPLIQLRGDAQDYVTHHDRIERAFSSASASSLDEDETLYFDLVKWIRRYVRYVAESTYLTESVMRAKLREEGGEASPADQADQADLAHMLTRELRVKPENAKRICSLVLPRSIWTNEILKKRFAGVQHEGFNLAIQLVNMVLVCEYALLLRKGAMNRDFRRMYYDTKQTWVEWVMQLKENESIASFLSSAASTLR